LDEAKFILDTIKQAPTGQSSLNDFAVLYRTNAQSRPFEDVFLRAGIAYKLVGGVAFYQRKEVKDVLAYLRLILNEKDEVSLERVSKLGKRRLQKFLEWRKTVKPTHDPLNLLDNLLKATDYLDLYNQDYEDDASRIENIKELRSVASEFNSLSSFLENVSLVQDKTMPNGKSFEKEANEAITLMTLHASKGLEFNSVFLVGMEEGLFPHSRSMLDKEEMEEERRLCYVGITRARSRLTLTHTRQRLYFGSRSSNTPSRFLSEIPGTVLKPAPSITSNQGKLIDQLLDDDLDIDDFLNS
jgi:DNA helicase-2/ATP-dependent DNA helicase PcrA